MQTRLKLEEGWSTFLLVWAMLMIAAVSIVQADLINGLQVVPVVATVALFTGLILAKSHFPSNTSHLFAVVYGMFAIFFFVGLLIPGDLTWRGRIFDIVNRQVVWIQKAVQGGTSRDGLIFIIHTSAIFWMLGYTAAWYTFRPLQPRVWRVIIPTGIVLLSVVYYYTGPRPLSLYLALYTLLALVYLSRTHLVEQERAWRSVAVRYDRMIWFTFMRAGVIAGLAALTISWMLPTMTASAAVGDALGSTQGPWREFQDNWTRLFASLRSYGTNTVDPYDDTLVLGGPRSVAETPIMDVYVPQKLNNVYWQAVVYDNYNGDFWSITRADETIPHFPDDGFIQTPPTISRQVVSQTVVNYLPNSSTLYAAPEVVGSDKQMFFEADQDAQGNYLISSVRSRFVLRQGDTYDVSSRISTADAESLRNTSTNYPDWVTDTYLQLPDTVTPETLALADELMAGYDNPFDKSLIVRDYLREAIKYNDQIDAPPDGMDSVHYALFVLQEGYCNYYASAMAVMLRSQGIPARVVSGYAQGDFDEDNSFYRVRASNAHTWVEVYFPRYGWIQFEPTAAIPTVDRPESSGEGGDAFEPLDRGPQDDEGLDEGGPENDGEQGLEEDAGAVDEGNGEDETAASDATGISFEDFPIWQALSALMVLAVAGGATFAGGEFNRRIEGDVLRSYSRLGTWARWLGLSVKPNHTPHERADMMMQAVPDDEGKSSILSLTQQFVLRRFSPRHEGDGDYDSLAAWKTLRPLLFKQALQNRFQRKQK